MMLLGLLAGTAVVLAGLVYIAKRHFGLPVMGLAVGMVVTQLWAADVMPYVAGVGIGIDRFACSGDDCADGATSCGAGVLRLGGESALVAHWWLTDLWCCGSVCVVWRAE